VDSNGSALVSLTEYRRYCNELSISMRVEFIFDKLSNYKFLKKGSVS